MTAGLPVSRRLCPDHGRELVELECPAGHTVEAWIVVDARGRIIGAGSLEEIWILTGGLHLFLEGAPPPLAAARLQLPRRRRVAYARAPAGLGPLLRERRKRGEAA